MSGALLLVCLFAAGDRMGAQCLAVTVQYTELERAVAWVGVVSLTDHPVTTVVVDGLRRAGTDPESAADPHVTLT